jgi:hypothetical protein
MAIPAAAHAAPTPASKTESADSPAQPHRPHASVRLDVGQTNPWVGQAIPVTVTAFFRDVEAVTLEGPVQLTSKAVITSELARDPRQSTELIGGEPTLVVKWTGTVTPSSPGPVDLAIELPVRIRYRDAAPRVIARETQDEDPFADFPSFGADPFDAASVFSQMRKRMQRQMQVFEQPAGRVREETATLKASVQSLEAIALPAANQPSTFSGAVGRFDIKSSVSSAHARISEPVTLRISVEGTGDLDRVDVSGVVSSDTWKAYPPKAVSEPSSPGKRIAGKVFEQVLVPLRGGDITVPAVAFTAFDPTSGKYVTGETAPILVSVDGTPVAADGVSQAAPSASASPAPLPEREAAPVRSLHLTPWTVGLVGGSVLFVALATGLYRLLRGKRAEWTLRRSMRRAASSGQAQAFLDTAHHLIEARLGACWGVPRGAVTAQSIRERLGDKGEPLVDALEAEEALRFGRGTMAGADLGALCSSIERALSGLGSSAERGV